MNHFKDNGTSFGKTGLRVDVKGDQTDPKQMEQAIKTLKRRVMQEGIIKDMRRIEYYEKPGDRRRREFSEAVKRAKKKQQQITETLFPETVKHAKKKPSFADKRQRQFTEK